MYLLTLNKFKMDYEFRRPPLLTIALFAGLFTGILVAVVNLIYDFIYRAMTNYSFSEIINVTSLIFFLILLLIVAGFIYFLLKKFTKRGDIIFRAFYIIATIVAGV